MKNRLASLLAFALLTIFMSCSKQQEVTSGTNNQLIRSAWQIHYSDRGQDLSAVYTEYALLFAENGSVVVKKGSDIFLGKWQLTEHGNGDADLMLNLSEGNSTIKRLSATWKLQSREANAIIFASRDVSQDVIFRISKP